jgi:hypothetical protein
MDAAVCAPVFGGGYMAQKSVFCSGCRAVQSYFIILKKKKKKKKK